MIPGLRKLAETLNADWQGVGYKTAAFPSLAARALSDFEPHRSYRLNALADWILRSRTFPAACNPFGSLGPPAFTVWSNSRFFVNVYAYNTPEVVIHDHNFAGAFVNASGRSIHCTYRFTAGERIDTSVRAGALDLAKSEVIMEGMVRQIEPGAGFIHQIWHISRPTVVLVIRTPALPGRSVRQFEYFRPAVATEIFRDRTFAPSAPLRFQYARKMMQCLRGSSEGIEYAARLIERERPWQAIWHLVENWRVLKASGELSDIIRRAAKRHGDWFNAMEAVGARAGLFYAIDWRRVPDEQDRIVLALLLTFDAWREVSSVLGSILPGAVPGDVVLDSLRRLGEQQSIPLTLSDESLAVLRCTLHSNGQLKEQKRLMRQSFEIKGRSDWAAARQIEHELREQELLKPLLNSTG
jgi:hypothetical protein